MLEKSTESIVDGALDINVKKAVVIKGSTDKGMLEP